MQSFSGAIINLILIMLMANVYTAVAEWLTKWGKLLCKFPNVSNISIKRKIKFCLKVKNSLRDKLGEKF